MSCCCLSLPQGQCLEELRKTTLRLFPELRVCLWGHSGTGVALACNRLHPRCSDSGLLLCSG